MLAISIGKRPCHIAITCNTMSPTALATTSNTIPTRATPTPMNRKGSILSPLRNGFFLMGGTRRAPGGINRGIGGNSIVYCIRTVGACGTVHTRCSNAVATVYTGSNSAISRSSMLVGVMW